MLVVHMVSFPVLVVPISNLVVLFTQSFHLVIFQVHLVVYLGLLIGSPLVLCTRNFIATPNPQFYRYPESEKAK